MNNCKSIKQPTIKIIHIKTLEKTKLSVTVGVIMENFDKNDRFGLRSLRQRMSNIKTRPVSASP